MKKLMVCLMAMMGTLALSAQKVYDFKVTDDAGKEVSLAQYKGKVLLIVNTATRCGFTPQYKELEELYQKYQAEGLEILDFPCNQFGQQAPGTIQEIKQFCSANFGIQFPQFDKIEVNGAGEHPLYTYLKAQKSFGGFDLNGKKAALLASCGEPTVDAMDGLVFSFKKTTGLLGLGDVGHVLIPGLHGTEEYKATDACAQAAALAAKFQ